jgi:hypothetical protein
MSTDAYKHKQCIYNLNLYFRQRTPNVTTLGLYVGQRWPDDDTASERYMRVEGNIYDEPENVSLDYINPVDDSDKIKGIKSQVQKKEKISSILSLLKKKSKAPELDKMEVKYIDIVETGPGPSSTPPLTTLTTTMSTCTMTTPSLPPKTKEARVLDAKTKSTVLPIKTKSDTDHSVTLETNGTAQPTAANTNTSTSREDPG